jgi:MATE family multidrug resistance protein
MTNHFTNVVEVENSRHEDTVTFIIHSDIIHNDVQKDILKTDDNSTTWFLIYLLFHRAVPVCLGFVLMFMMNFITMAFAGHIQLLNQNISQEEATTIFAGISLANMFSVVSFLSIIIGTSSAIETLARQNFGGKNYIEVGIILQRSILICNFIAIPLTSLWFYSESIFLYIGVEANVTKVIYNYLMIRIIAIPIDILTVCYDKYLCAIGVVTPPVYANIMKNIVLVSCNILFIYVLKYSYWALALSWCIAGFAGLGTMISVSLSHPSVQITLQSFHMSAFLKWPEFMYLAFPATLMLCSEWWSFEFLTLMASKLGTTEVSAQTIIIQVASLGYMIPLGISVSTSSLVGNFLGAYKNQIAIRISKLAIMLTVTTQLIFGIFLFFFGHYLIVSYTNNPDIIRVALMIIPFLSCK